MQKQHNYNPLSFSSRLQAYIDKVKADYERTIYYKKHWHLVELIENLEIFTVNRFAQIAAECGIKTTRRTVSTFFFYLHLDNFLEFTPVITLMGQVAQLYNIDTIDPERKNKAIKYYESINPRAQEKHDHKKNKQIQSFIDSYQSSNLQSAAYTKARIDRADEAETAAKERNPEIAAEGEAIRQKDWPTVRKLERDRKKKEKAKTSKK